MPFGPIGPLPHHRFPPGLSWPQHDPNVEAWAKGRRAAELEHEETQHEVECPSCGITIRARMSDTTPDDLRQVRARAFADGRLAAFADTSDLTPLIANRTGFIDPAGELHGIASDSDDDTTRERLTRIARAIRGEDQE